MLASHVAHPATASRTITAVLLLGLGLWGAGVAVLARQGAFLAIPMPAIALLVAMGIALPTLGYFASPAMRAYFAAVGLFPITALHVWRVPAALAFFGYGLAGQLPAPFWLLAGTGDLVAGLYACKLMLGGADDRGYLRFHLFGFADFVVAVGTGLTFTLLQDPRMAAIAVLPLALIPLFGVGISGASHLIAFDQLRRRSANAVPRARMAE